MGGWTIVALQPSAGHVVTYLDSDTGDENLAGTFGHQVSVAQIIETVLANAEVGDWIITPSGEPLIVAERPSNRS